MTTQIEYIEPVKVIAGIIKEELQLADEQIMLAYEKYMIPKTDGLYIALNYVSSKKIGGGSRAVPVPTGMQEEQTVTMLHLIQIDLMSFDSEARVRKEEILMALSSIEAEMEMNRQHMQIARMPSSFVNTASLEETKILNRFTITISVTAAHAKIKTTPNYFDKFQTEFQTELNEEPINADPQQVIGGFRP